MKWMYILITHFLMLTVVNGIRITGLDVPTVALTGDEIRLRCDYDMDGGSSLYSLKWYKDEKEFYRHVPGNGQTASQRCSVSNAGPSMPGVSIDCWGSSEKEVVLMDVSNATSGEYRCEVIGDHPAFRREERKARLTVFTEPLKKPVILGAASEYSLGSKVSLNCTSRNHEYFPTLAWFVNSQPAKEREIIYPYHSNKRTLGLYFEADQTRFIHGQVKVSCRANLGAMHEHSASKTLSIPGLLTPQYYSKGSTYRRLDVVMLITSLIVLLNAYM